MARQLIPTNTKREDCVQTPIQLAVDIMNHFRPSGKVLEPCKGDGNFLEAYNTYNLIAQMTGGEGIQWTWCEILDGKDFFEFNEKVDWIITNPPYSKMRKFLQHSMDIADNVVFLTTINHLWLKARLRDIQEKSFGIKEIIVFPTPKTFPQAGFQIGCFHLQKNYVGDIKYGQMTVSDVCPTESLIGIKRKPCEVSQILNGTSLNSDIIQNSGEID